MYRKNAALPQKLPSILLGSHLLFLFTHAFTYREKDTEELHVCYRAI